MRKQRERDSIRFGDSLRARALVVDGEVAKGNEAIIRFLGQFQHDAGCKTKSVLLRLWTVPKHMSSRATRSTYRSLRAILPGWTVVQQLHRPDRFGLTLEREEQQTGRGGHVGAFGKRGALDPFLDRHLRFLLLPGGFVLFWRARLGGSAAGAWVAREPLDR